MALAYIDYSSAEFMIGASMSDGHCGPINNMMDLYRSGDPYLNFAKRVGAIPKDGTKQTHGEVRDKYKTFLLAVTVRNVEQDCVGAPWKLRSGSARNDHPAP